MNAGDTLELPQLTASARQALINSSLTRLEYLTRTTEVNSAVNSHVARRIAPYLD